MPWPGAAVPWGPKSAQSEHGCPKTSSLDPPTGELWLCMGILQFIQQVTVYTGTVLPETKPILRGGTT